MSAGERATVGMVTVRYWASLRAAAGVSEDRLEAGPLAVVLAAASQRHGARFDSVLGICSVLVDGQPLGPRDPADLALPAGSVVDLLPPFAGGASAC